MNPKLVKAALALGGVGMALLFISRMQALSHPPAKPIDSAPVLKELAAAHQPAAALERVQQAGLQGDGCHYIEEAARGALDANLPKLVEQLLDAAPRDCTRKMILLGERAEGLARASSSDEASVTAKEALTTHAANGYAELALARVAYDANHGSCFSKCA
jgi:hypothetical protein